MNQEMSFSSFKINCTQIGALMGNSKTNMPPAPGQVKKLLSIIGRDYGELSESMKHTAYEIMTKYIDYEPNRPTSKILTEIVLKYCYEQYGKSKISKGNDSPLQIEKGQMAEPESIRMLSELDGVEYIKNTELFENKWLKGIPDILVRSESGKITKVIEIKTSYDLPSFILNKYNPERSSNILQLMGCLDLVGCNDGEIVHVLSDMPQKIANFQEKKLKQRHEMLELDDSESDRRINEALLNMEYSEIPNELKIFRRKYTKNKLTVRQIKSRVTSAKKWMQQIHDIFTTV